MRGISRFYGMHEKGAKRKAYSRLAAVTRWRESTRLHELSAGGYRCYVNNSSATVSPMVGVVIDSGCAAIVRDGMPVALLSSGGCCTISTTEPVEDIVDRLVGMEV